MEMAKQGKITEAKKKMEEQKKILQVEKQTQLKQVREIVKHERPQVGGNSMIGDNFDYMNMMDHNNSTPSPTKV